MSRSLIESRIPHRSPMLLLDEILEQDDSSIRCRKTFAADEFFFQGHYPGHAIVPGVILCESAMQAGAVLLSEQLKSGHGVPVATRMNNVKFRKVVHPGDTIELAVELTDRLADAFFLTAKVTLAGKVAARLEFACTMTET